MEPKEENIVPKMINQYLKNAGKGILADQLKKELEKYGDDTKYESEVLYAVKEQIDWAVKMLKYAKYRKHLSFPEIDILRKIRNKGCYLESEKPLLNEILKKYQDE